MISWWWVCASTLNLCHRYVVTTNTSKTLQHCLPSMYILMPELCFYSESAMQEVSAVASFYTCVECIDAKCSYICRPVHIKL